MGKRWKSSSIMTRRNLAGAGTAQPTVVPKAPLVLSSGATEAEEPWPRGESGRKTTVWDQGTGDHARRDTERPQKFDRKGARCAKARPRKGPNGEGQRG